MPRFTKAQKEKYIKQYEECMREKYGGILEKENKHLKEEMEIMTNFCGACKKMHEEEIKTLKHNKKTVAHLSSCISDVQDKQIEQAKEIIRKMLFALSDNRVSFLSNPYYDLEKQAEQFINLSEKATISKEQENDRKGN